jgi:hypothetical protein
LKSCFCIPRSYMLPINISIISHWYTFYDIYKNNGLWRFLLLDSYYIIIIMISHTMPTAGHRPPMDLHIDRLCNSYIQRLPPTINRSSFHLVGLFTEHRPVRGRHCRTFRPKQPPVLRCILPAAISAEQCLNLWKLNRKF